MNTFTVSYFVQKFGTYDTEELRDLISRRADLSDEAVEALNHVLAEKGLKDSDLIVEPPAAPPLSPVLEETRIREQTKSSRALWKSWLSKICKFLVALIFVAPIQAYLKTAIYGSLWEGLIILIGLYAGYSTGHALTKNICSNADVSIQAKKKKLWILFVTLLPTYLVVYVVSNAYFGRGQ